jgi:hypothetical protein
LDRVRGLARERAAAGGVAQVMDEYDRLDLGEIDFTPMDAERSGWLC